MTKAELRKVYKQRRMELSLPDKRRADDLILIQFQTIDLPQLDVVLSYASIETSNEVDAEFITEYMRFRHPSLRIAYPRMNMADNTMQAVIVGADTPFESNAVGIDEPVGGTAIDPEGVDLIIVPLLAFDGEGYRVGYGKGYYDRFMAGCRKECIAIGVSHFEASDRIDDRRAHDVPLNFCVTPTQVYVF